MKLVEIYWIDSGQFMAKEWTDPQVVKERAYELSDRVRSVGYILDKNSQYTLLAMNIDQESGAVAGVMRIANQCILSWVELVGEL